MTEEQQAKEIPPEMIHISEVYKWGQNPRIDGGRLTQRTIQWYTTSGLLPAAKRIGKAAFYNRYTIFSYLRSIEILNRRFDLLLSEVKKILYKVHGFEELEVGQDEEYQPIFLSGIGALNRLLEDFLEYIANEESQVDQTQYGPDLSSEQRERIDRLQSEILKRLRGSKETVKKLLSDGLIRLEEEIFPKGKVHPQEEKEPF